MDVQDFSQYQEGDIISLSCCFGVKAIGIFKRIDEDRQTVRCYCVSYNDLHEQMYFTNGERYCSFNLDAINAVAYASDYEIKILYNKIIARYEKEESGLYDYFTDSTFFELGDWFAYNCGLDTNEGDHFHLKFVDEFTCYAWDELCKKTNNYEEAKTESTSKVLWIARDIYNGLNLFEKKPVIPNPSGYDCYYSDGKAYKIDDRLFPEVNETNSPQRVRIELIKE